MRLLIAALLLCVGFPTYVEARPTPYRGDTFSGDRYVARPVTQARPVVRQRYSAKVRYYYRVKRAPAPRLRQRAPMTMASGLRREVGRAVVGSRPGHCPARSWCGCYLADHLGLRHRRDLWLARNWARVGSPAHGPRVGAVVVWRHHVGKITEVSGNRIRVLSGNDSRAVRNRWRTVRGVIAYRIAG